MVLPWRMAANLELDDEFALEIPGEYIASGAGYQRAEDEEES